MGSLITTEPAFDLVWRSWNGRAGTGWRCLVVLLLMVLAAAPAGARPGDLAVDMDLTPPTMGARPTDVAATAAISGNVSFDQPTYQRATADLTATTDRNWTATVSPSRVVSRGPGVQTFTVAVTVPTSALAGETTTVTVTARASTRIGTTAETVATATVSVEPWSAFWVNASDPIVTSVPVSSVVDIAFVIRNIGSVDERYTVTVPYWFGLQRYGLLLDTPPPVPVRARSSETVLVHVTTQAGTVPRVYECQLLVLAETMPDGGSGPTANGKPVRAWVNVTGTPPQGDRYGAWSMGEGPTTPGSWYSVFGSTEGRAAPDVDAGGRYIVFSQAMGGGGAAVLMGPIDGSATVRLTSGDHADLCPVISPDGARVAFVRDGQEVVVVNGNGTVLDTLVPTLGDATLTDWSPTGDRVLLEAEGDIYELDLAMNATRLLATEPVEQWGATYSVDGSRVYYLSYEAAGVAPEVWSMTSDGSDHRQLTYNDLREGHVTMSPNGQRIAFALQDRATGGDRLCVMATDGSGVRWITEGRERLGQVRWVPDGLSIVAEVHISSSGSFDIQRVDYPWRDGGGKGGSDDGGGGDGGASGGGGGGVAALGDLRLVLTAVVLAMVVAVLLGYRAYDRRRRTQAAARLKDVTGKGDAAAAHPPLPLGDAREGEGGIGYAAYDAAVPPVEAPPAVVRVTRR
jgi:hypothetical protein